jgi:hypothetical protein
MKVFGDRGISLRTYGCHHLQRRPPSGIRMQPQAPRAFSPPLAEVRPRRGRLMLHCSPPPTQIQDPRSPLLQQPPTHSLTTNQKRWKLTRLLQGQGRCRHQLNWTPHRPPKPRNPTAHQMRMQLNWTPHRPPKPRNPTAHQMRMQLDRRRATFVLPRKRTMLEEPRHTLGSMHALGTPAREELQRKNLGRNVLHNRKKPAAAMGQNHSRQPSRLKAAIQHPRSSETDAIAKHAIRHALWPC